MPARRPTSIQIAETMIGQSAPAVEHLVEKSVVDLVVILGVAADALPDRDDPPDRQVGRTVDVGGHPIETAQVVEAVEVGIDESAQQQAGLGQTIRSDQLGKSSNPLGDSRRRPLTKFKLSGVSDWQILEAGASSPRTSNCD